ncbi:hypothetical protein [Methylobacterium sp. D48H]
MSKNRPDIQGEVTSVHDNVVEGWAWVPDSNNMRLVIDIVDDDKNVLVRTTAARFDKALLGRGIGDGFHGFKASVPAAVFRQDYMNVMAIPQLDSEKTVGASFRIKRPAVLPDDVLRIISDPDVRERLVVPDLWLRTNGQYYESGLSAMSPYRVIDFSGEVCGEGWITTPRGSMINETGCATIRLSRLPVKKSRLNIKVIGDRDSIDKMKIQLDEQSISSSFEGSHLFGAYHVVAPLPAAQTIVTPVTLSIFAERTILFLNMAVASIDYTQN